MRGGLIVLWMLLCSVSSAVAQVSIGINLSLYPEVVPVFVLRIPVGYYRRPPVYFRGWRPDAPPRWGEHWGRDWEQRRSGWDRWDRSSGPRPAPLPVYQRQYSGDRYPRLEQQHPLHSQQYRYEPRDTVVRQHYREQAARSARTPAQRGDQGALQQGSDRQPHQEPPRGQGQGQEKGRGRDEERGRERNR